MAMWQHTFGVYVWRSVWRCKLSPAYISTQNTSALHSTRWSRLTKCVRQQKCERRAGA